MKIDVVLLAKNGTTQIDKLTVEAGAVPRVGELVDVPPGQTSGEEQTYLVTAVTYICSQGGLIPEIRCRQWFSGDRNAENRREELGQQGWL